MNFRELLRSNTVLLDGGMGTLLQSAGLLPGESPEEWNLTHADRITEIHRQYFEAGSNVVSTNTFGANTLKFSPERLDAIVGAAVQNARAAQSAAKGECVRFVALDIGPTGKLLKPYGDLDFEDAVSVFAETVRLGVKYGVDLILIETMNDSYETKAALLAAKENSTLPILVSNAYGEDGKLMTGADPFAMVAMLEGMGADAIGVNCSLGPHQLRPVIECYLQTASVPVLLKPNAGLPKSVNGATVFDITPDEFASEVSDLVSCGVRLAGGCCGTTPAYIQKLAERIQNRTPLEIAQKHQTVVSSYTHAISFGDMPVLIGERINPTGKKRFRQALLENDMDYILREGISQQEKGVQMLDVNVGLPDIDEASVLTRAVCELQAIIDLPLQIDTANAEAMEAALRRYNGKAMINSVNGKEESMRTLFPLVKKYGGVVVALTLDENGIPETAEGRVAIAKKIVERAKTYGIDQKDLIFDPLAMTVSADPRAAIETLRAVRHIRSELGCHTSLGVSNVSFGLPRREAVNSTFFAQALENGLSAAIMNPYSIEMLRVWYAHRVLHGQDPNGADYIAFSTKYDAVEVANLQTERTPAPTQPTANDAMTSSLQAAIEKGLCERARALTQEYLEREEPLVIVQNEIIPALDRVGIGFEEKRVYLPQLLISAEAAQSAFGVIKARMESSNAPQEKKGTVVIATVSGDIHDIGKNIVRLLLENYGFSVIDLGKDVPAKVIADEVIRLHAPLVGLSALMTTTVPAMEETIALLHKDAPWCRVMVGGAVLNADYAARIGADRYCKDAMGAVRYAETLFAES